jgi:SAM-dependent methyltransferase
MKMPKKAYGKMYEVEDEHWWYIGRRKILGSLLAGLEPNGGWQILDAGCGTGGNFDFLDSYGTVRGCDFSEDAIRYCNMRGGHEVKLASIYKMPYEDASFDLATSLDVIEHLRFDLPAFEELWRVVKPGGHILVTLPVGRHLYSDFDCLSGHLRRYRFKEVRKLLAESGFEPVRMTCYAALVQPLTRYYMWRGCITKGRLKWTEGMETIIPASNKFLCWILELEAGLLARMDLKMGSSMAVLARKPVPSDPLP